MTNYNNEVPVWLREATKQYHAKKKKAKSSKSNQCDGCGAIVSTLHGCVSCGGRFCTNCVLAYRDCGYYCEDCQKPEGIGPSQRIIAPGITKS